MKKKLVLAVLGCVACAWTNASALTITKVAGSWVNADPAGDITINNSGPSGGISTARWGTDTGFGQSGYDFVSRSTSFEVEADGTLFALGDFTHQNWPITAPSLNTIDLKLDLASLGIFDLSATFNFTHDETPNDPGPPVSNDLVTLSNPTVSHEFAIGSTSYYFSLIGFSQDAGASLATFFSTIEEQNNTATLYAQITDRSTSQPIPEPTTMLLFGTSLIGLAGAKLRKKKRGISKFGKNFVLIANG